MIAQTFDWLKQGFYVDAKDKHGDWQVSLVMTITKSHIKIRFDGWASKSDQIYPLITQRIKPFRSITKGYTGQRKSPAIRQHWVFAIENHETRMDQFSEFTSHLSQKSAFQINQYMRGENYFYIDFLLSLSFNNVDHIKKVYDYFRANFEFVKRYFQQFIQRDTNVWFQAGQKQQLTTKKVYAELYNEIFDSIASIIGSVPRCAVFIKNNQKLFREIYGNDVTYDVIMTRELYNMQFFTKFEEVVTKICTETKNGLRNTPLTFINSLYSLFNALDKTAINTQLKKKLNTEFVTIVQEYIAAMSIQDAKTNEKTIDQVLTLTRIICNRLHADKEEMCRWVEKARLKLWIYLIQCDVLQKKLRGIGKLKDFYELISRKLINPYENSQIICTRMQFREWMDQENLLKTIFEANEHSEVIKKGCEMVQYFYTSKHKVSFVEDLVYIWQACFHKHEAIKRIVFQFWNDIAPQITSKEEWKMFVSVLTKNEDNINEEWELESLFGFLHAIKSDDDNESITEVISMMYRKTLKEQKHIPELAKELSYFESGSKVLQSMVDHCLNQISSKIEPIFHLKLLAKLYFELQNVKTYIPENIVNVLIGELREFITKEENEKLVVTIFNLFNEILMTKDIEPGSSEARLTFENFETLWDMFSKCHIGQFRRYFFSWMVHRSYQSMHNYAVYQINHRFSHDFRLEIFSNVLCDQTKFTYGKLDQYEFAVFKEFFIYANGREGSLECKTYNFGSTSQPYNRRVIRTKSRDIQGLRELWQIFKHCENEEVVILCSSFLKDLYLRVSSLMGVEERTERTKSLMEIIESSMSEGEKNGSFNLTKRVLILISKLLTDIKQRIELPKQLEKGQRAEKQTITVYIQATSEAVQLQISVCEPFVNIKSQIARKLHLTRDEFSLYSGKGEIPKQFYDLPYYMHSVDDSTFKLVRVVNETGKYVMASICQHLYHKIISFLRNDQLCTEAFHLLEYLDLYQPLKLFDQLAKDIQDRHSLVKNKKKLYLHIFFTRLFLHLVDKQIAQLHTDLLEKFISHLEIPIENHLLINYLQKILEILTDLNKKTNQEPSPISLNTHRPKLYLLMLNTVKYMNSSPRTVTMNQVKLFNNSLSLYITAIDNQKLLFDTFIKDQHFRQFMFEIFIKCQVLQVKKIVQKKICLWLKEGFCSTNQQRKIAQFFINELYYAIYQKDAKKQISGAEFTGIFKLFKTILESISNQTFREIIYESPSPVETTNMSFSNHIFNSIFRLADSPTSPNFMLNGQLQILVGMIKRDRSLLNEQMIDYLLYNCLIYVNGKTHGMEVKCLFKQNITLVLEILWYAMVQVEAKEVDENVKVNFLTLDKYTEMILAQLREFHYSNEWRNSREWATDFLHMSKTKNDFVGLQNPGCICYLNSLLQQLFMIEPFRYAVLSMTTPAVSQQIEIDTAAEQDSPDLIPKLKLLFLSLMFSERSAIDPQFFTSSIRTAGNRPMVKIFEQMDIDEFSMILFDKIENKIHRQKMPNFVRELFGGAYSNEIISQECSHSSEREEQFLSISLDVKKQLTQSFQSLVKGEMLEGENAYFCDGCDKKVKALKRLSIKRLPLHLIISLRRFEFDYEADQKIKINKYCEFPFELNLESYSQDKLNESNQGKKSEQQSSTSMNDQEPPQQKKNNLPKEYFVYKLKGVVVHTGSADSGHYYSYIESQDGGWFEFNDERVSEFDVKNLGEEAFGGKDGEYTRIRNAYLLFYERKGKRNFSCYQVANPAEQSQCENMAQRQPGFGQVSNIDSNPSANRQNPSANRQNLSSSQCPQLLQPINKDQALQLGENGEAIKQIIMENKKMREWHFLFSKEYMEWVLSLVKQALYPIYGLRAKDFLKQITEYQEIKPTEAPGTLKVGQHSTEFIFKLQEELFRFLVTYAFLINFRLKHFGPILELFNAINQIFFQHPDPNRRLHFVQAFLQEISQQSFFDEFLIGCPNKEKSKMVGNFIVQAIKTYLSLRPNQDTNPVPEVVMTIIKLAMRTVIKTNSNLVEALVIVRKLIGLNKSYPNMVFQIITFLLKKNFVAVMIDNLLCIDTPKDTRTKKIQNLENENVAQVEVQQQQQKKTASQRKDSDLSARDEEEGVPTKKKHLNEKIEIEGEVRNLDEKRFSILFGQYQQEESMGTKSSQKEAWTILYEIQQHMKARKQHIGAMKEEIRAIKKVPIEQERDYQPQKPLKPQPPAAKLPPAYDRNISTVNNQEFGGTEEEESSSIEEQSEEDGSWNEQDESPLNQDDMKEVMEVDENLRAINQIYTELVPVPKAMIETETHVANHAQQIHSVDVNFNQNPLVNEHEARPTIEVHSADNQQNAETKSLPSKVNELPAQQAKSPKKSPSPNLSPQSPASQPPKAQIELSRQQQQQLSQLEESLPKYEKQFSEMDVKLYVPFSKLKTQKIMKIISEQKDTKSIIALAAFLCNLAFNTINFSDTILNAIESGLKDYENSKYRALFIVLEKLLQIEDDLTRKRICHVLSILRSSLRQNEKYFLESDFTHQFILRYAAKIPAFQALFRQTSPLLNEIKIWISQKRTPSSEAVRKHRQGNCERLLFRLHEIMVSGEMKEYDTFATYKFESFEKIRQNRFTSRMNFSEEPRVGETYQKGDVVEVYLENVGYWTEAIVEENYFSILLLQYKTSNSKHENILMSEDEEHVKLKASPKLIEVPEKMEIEN